MARTTTTPAIGALQGAFFLSGAGALVFESVWFSQASLVVGNSVWSAALVMAAFMAGLALGNGLAAVFARRWRNPAAGYALLEALAAVSGTLLVAGFPYLPALFRPLLASMAHDPAALSAARLAIAFGLMVIPATAFGATLPVLARPLEALTGSYGFSLGRLYGINTLGAVAGALLAELVLIPWLGLRASGFVAAGCNLVAAGIAFQIRGVGSRAFSSVANGFRLRGIGRILGAAFLAGGALLALEVVWFRFLLLFLDGTTLIFALMLAVVLAGIGVGGLAASQIRLSAAMARAAAAAAAVAVVACYAAFDPIVQLARSAVVLSAFLMAPVALLSGFLFTALGVELRSRMPDASSATGALTLANTLGALAGSLAAAFVLLPLAGMEGAFFVLALVYALVALVIPAPAASLRRRLLPAAAAALALVLFPFGTMKETHYRAVEARFAARLVAAREGVEQTVFYLSHEFLGEPLFLRLATNSYSMASTAVGVQRYMKLFAWLPAALHPKIENVLVICFGVGATASAVTGLPEVQAVDVVDVSRDILELSDVVHPDPRRHPLRDPRVSTHVEDGRFYLQTTARRYDLITGEPPPPKMAGVASLYTREYFALMKDRLTPGGLATYWLPGYLLLESEALAIIRAFCEAFEDCSLWSGFNRDWILLGSNGGIAPVPPAHFSRLWKLDGPGTELRRLGIDSPEQLAAQFMADADALRELTSRTPPLVDDHPRRIRAALYPEPARHYAWLMDAARGRERLETSPWAGILPSSVLASSADAFRLRAMFDAALYPDLRGEHYEFWSDLAALYRRTGLVELPRWLLGSGAQAAQIAARVGPAHPVAAEHLAIDAVANRRLPPAIDHERFSAMTPWAQTVTVFHHCLAGEPARARTLMDMMAQRDLSFFSWADRECR